MGFNILNLFTYDKSPDEVHRDYDVVPTNQFEGLAEAPVSGTILPCGGYLLCVFDQTTPGDSVFKKLSTNASLLICYADEHVMNSYAAYWSDGRELWSVWHDAQQGIEHLETSGTLPDVYESIHHDLMEQQKTRSDIDYVFDIPIELFAELTGFAYDRDIEPIDPKRWQILERQKYSIAQSISGFMHRLIWPRESGRSPA